MAGPRSAGTRFPAWLPPGLHLPAKLVLGGALGGAIGAYAVALAFAANRILTGLETGAAPAALAPELAHMLLLLGLAPVTRRLLRRPQGVAVIDL